MIRPLLWLACYVTLIFGAAVASADDAWKPLFNGKDLTGWEPVGDAANVWRVEDGILICGGGRDGWLSTDKEYANFELELEFRLLPGSNSGVFLRSPREGTSAYVGMEIQVLDDDAEVYATIQPWQHCGSLYGVVAAKPGALKKPGQWQTYHIVCDGRKVKVTLNGIVVVDANLDDHKDKEATHPGLKRTTGYIGLQDHGTPVAYRNIRIRTLD